MSAFRPDDCIPNRYAALPEERIIEKQNGIVVPTLRYGHAPVNDDSQNRFGAYMFAGVVE
jgi:hypothetical protein